MTPKMEVLEPWPSTSSGMWKNQNAQSLINDHNYLLTGAVWGLGVTQGHRQHKYSVMENESVSYGPNFYPRWSVLWDSAATSAATSSVRGDGTPEFEFGNGWANPNLNPEDAHKWSHIRLALRGHRSGIGTVGRNGPIRPHAIFTLIGCLAADAASWEGVDADQGQFCHSVRYANVSKFTCVLASKGKDRPRTEV